MNPALELALSITEEELKFISQADYGQDSERHYEALKKLIFDQKCIVNSDQYWYPYEVVELARWTCKDGHEREFAICNAIIGLSILAGADGSNEPEYMLDTIASDYDKLPAYLKEVVLNILVEASGQC